MEYLIRPMTEKDLPAVAEIERQCFSKPWSEEELGKCFCLDNYRFFISEAASGTAGYVGIAKSADEGDVVTLAVLPKFRRQGMAMKLMKAVLGYAEAEGINYLFLEVRVSNLPARTLYERLGFTTVGLRPDYYEAPRENALLMKYERRAVC